MKQLLKLLFLLLLPVACFAQDLRPSAYLGAPGKVTVRGGKVLGSTGGVTTIAEQTINPAVSATTYIYIDLSSTPAVATSTSGFPASSYFPICVVTKDANNVITAFTDSRPDAFMAGGGGGITSVSSAALPTSCTPDGSVIVTNTIPKQIYKCIGGVYQPDFSTVIDAKAYGVKADAKVCLGQFLTINSGSSSVSCFSALNSSAASVTANVATITLSGNPLTVGAIPWIATHSVTITNFTGGDTYFNGTFTLTGVTATTITFALVHANASATTFGTVMNNNVGPFSTAADVTAGPKLLFATNGAGGRDLSQAGTLILAQSTLNSVTNSTTVVASNTATGNSLGASTGELVWGTDDTVALDATSIALANAPDCGIVLLPMGNMLTSKGLWQIDSPGCVLSTTNGTSIQYGSGAIVKGWGPNASKVIPLPLFDFTTARNGSLFGSPNFMVYDEWSIYGAGLGTNGNNLVSIVAMNTESVGINFQIVAWLGADAQTIGLTFNGRCWACRVQGSGGTGMSVGGGPSHFTNGVVNYSKIRALNIPNGNVLNSTASVFGSTATQARIAVLVDGTWNSTNDQISGPIGGATTDVCLQVNAGATANFTNLNLSTAGCGGGGASYGLYNHGGKVRLVNSTIAGGTTGAAILQDASGIVYDGGGNTYSGSTTLLNGVTPTCTFTSGGGTTPSCALQVGSTNEKGTIIASTGTGAPGTTGTITLTFAGTFAGGSNTTPSCTYTLNDSGTAWGNESVVRVSTQSTTVPVLAWSNVATAILTALATSSPYRIDYVCVAR